MIAKVMHVLNFKVRVGVVLQTTEAWSASVSTFTQVPGTSSPDVTSGN